MAHPVDRAVTDPHPRPACPHLRILGMLSSLTHAQRGRGLRGILCVLMLRDVKPVLGATCGHVRVSLRARACGCSAHVLTAAPVSCGTHWCRCREGLP